MADFFKWRKKENHIWLPLLSHSNQLHIFRPSDHFLDLLVRSVRVDAVSAPAGVAPTLIHVDPAVGAVEALVALAAERVADRDALAVVAGVVIAVV